MPKKELGQHWLHDRDILSLIAEAAAVNSDDTVLEIGPGLGTLTSVLLARAKKVIAVEFDAELAGKLAGQFPGKDLTVTQGDFLRFDLDMLPSDYKVVANVPYYITAKIVQRLATADNSPSIVALLVQKEVAERLAARPGDLSILALSAQMFFDVSTDIIVPAEAFTPPPRVDSQVVVLKRRAEPLVLADEQKAFFRLIHAGFAERRKKLRSSLAGGFHIGKPAVDAWLRAAGISPEARAQELSIAQWLQLLAKTPSSE